MAVDLGKATEAIEALIRGVDEDDAREAEAEEAARKMVATHRANRIALSDKREKLVGGLEAVRASMGDLFSPGGHSFQSIGDATKQIVSQRKPIVQQRARIGPQRYLMLDALRIHGASTIDFIAQSASLEVRRVRDQMAADAIIGVVEQMIPTGSGESIPAYALTAEGLELLERFEAYRKSRGMPLPTIDDIDIQEPEKPTNDSKPFEIPDHIRAWGDSLPEGYNDQFTGGITDEH